jgi:hypothetical protein
MDASAVVNLKQKVISDFDKFRNHLYKGHCKDYQLIIYEITAIEDSDYFDNTIYEYLMSTAYE